MTKILPKTQKVIVWNTKAVDFDIETHIKGKHFDSRTLVTLANESFGYLISIIPHQPGIILLTVQFTHMVLLQFSLLPSHLN